MSKPHCLATAVALCLVLAILLSSACAAAGSDSRFSFRGIWVDVGSYNTPQLADKMLDQCKRAKINVIIASVLAHGALMHKSTHFLHTVVANDDFDPLAYITAKAHAMGIQVHAWYAVYYEGVKGLQPAHPDWLCSDIDGKRMSETYFLSPQVPGVNDYLLSVIRDSLAYDIDGVQLDYIRYYGSSYDYSQAGRQPFIDAYGFDPMDFLDHSEKIVPPEKDRFPIRVLHSQHSMGRPWETTWIESLMDRAGIGFGFVSESAATIDALRAPGALVVSEVFDVSPELADAIERYVNRGGSVVWLDCPVVSKNPKLARVLGIRPSEKWLPKQWRKLEPVGVHPLARMIPNESFNSTVEYAPKTDGGTIVARFESGEPAVIVNRYGKGNTVLICFNAGSAGSYQIVRSAVDWLRSESGVKMDRDLMAAKRAEWLKWRSSRITDLVRRVHDALKAKNSELEMSVAGGFSGEEYYSCMRDGHRWMAENLLDFANPMDYFDTVQDLEHALAEHKANVSPERLSTIYPGLSLYTSKTIDGKRQTVSQDANILRDQLALLRKNGYRGFALFCSAQLSEEQIKVIADAAR